MICEVSWDAIRVSPFQPRRIFNAEELEELAASIRSVGLIHPPVVRAIEAQGKRLYYELIAGERRWRAAKLAGYETLKVIVRTSSDEHALRSALIENVQRVNLNPIELAEAYKKLIDVFRMSQEEVAEKVGKKRSTVTNYLRLLSLPEPIRNSLSAGEMTIAHAKTILSLDSEELRAKLAALIVEKKLNVRDAEKARRKMSSVKKQSGMAAFEEFEERLRQQFTTKVKIEQSKKGGRVTLHYYNAEDLERLLGLLGALDESD